MNKNELIQETPKRSLWEEEIPSDIKNHVMDLLESPNLPISSFKLSILRSFISENQPTFTLAMNEQSDRLASFCTKLSSNLWYCLKWDQVENMFDEILSSTPVLDMSLQLFVSKLKKYAFYCPLTKNEIESHTSLFLSLSSSLDYEGREGLFQPLNSLLHQLIPLTLKSILQTSLPFSSSSTNLSTILTTLFSHDFTSIRKTSGFLDGPSKMLMLLVERIEERGGVEKVKLSVDRNDVRGAFKGFIQSVEGRRTSTSPIVPLMVPSFVSSFNSNKRSHDGEMIEEGEGTGLRKEVCEMLAHSFTASTKKVNLENTSCHIMPNSFREDEGELRVDGRYVPRVGDFVVVTSLSSSKQINSPHLLPDSTDGMFEIIEVKDKYTKIIKLDKPLPIYDQSEVVIYERIVPPLSFSQDLGGYWINPSCQNKHEFYELGIFLAILFSHCSTTPYFIPPPFFHLLMSPNESDLDVLERLFGEWNSSFKQMLSKFGMREELISNAIGCENGRREFEELKRGFNLLFSDQVLLSWGVGCEDLSFSLSSLPPSSPLDLRDVFRIEVDKEMDPEFVSVFWEVISSLSAEDHSLVLRFITGVGTYPLPKTQSLSIELMVTVGLPHAASLLPQAHTCDNILELPDYWTLVGPSRVRNVLEEKLLMAASLSDGYGLDGLESKQQETTPQFNKNIDNNPINRIRSPIEYVPSFNEDEFNNDNYGVMSPEQIQEEKKENDNQNRESPPKSQQNSFNDYYDDDFDDDFDTTDILEL